MDEVKELTPPPALYDYVLYFECAPKDWNEGAKKTSIKGDGSLMNLINWNSTYSYDPNDAGGKTLFGVTESTWGEFVKKYPNKGYNKDLNSMGKQGWLDVVHNFWNNISYGANSANYACAFALFQMAWGGFGKENRKKLLETLKNNADIKEYNYVKESGEYTYKEISDATHAYTDPMIAYDYIRKAKSTYLYNISTPDRTNSIYRCGWLTRNTLSFTPYGLYIPVGVNYDTANLKYESTLNEWEDVAVRWAQENKTGYVKIFDWGKKPESIEKITSNSYNYANSSEVNNSKSNNSTGGSYSNCGGVHLLGSYSNSQTTKSQNSNSKILEAIEKLKTIHTRGEKLYNTLTSNDTNNDTDTIKCSKFYTPCKTPQSFT